MTERFDQITEAQRECLRLVLGHHNSKEIAAKLGVSPSAVDKRIERAVQQLGAVSRFAAARMLAQHEDPASDRLPWQAIDVPEPASGVDTGPAEQPWGLVRRLLGLEPSGREAGPARVRLGHAQRLVLVVVLMIVIATTTMVLLNLAATMSALIREHHIRVPR